MVDTIELRSAPKLTRLYAAAVAGSRGRRGGKPLPDVTVVRDGIRVDPDRLADYAAVCGFTLRDRLPITYLHNLAFPLQVTLFTDRRYPYPLVGSVHLSNRLVQHRPVGLDEPITLRVFAQHARAHKRGVQVEIASTALVGGDIVWEGLATYLYRGQKLPSTGRGSQDGVGSRQHDGEAPSHPAETEPPDGPGAVWRLPGDLGRRFASVSGDVNPIHMNPYAAKAMGFPRTIVHGMWSQAAMLASLESKLPEAYAADMTFRRPVLIPGKTRFVARHDGGAWDLALRDARKDTVLVRGTVTPVTGRSARGRPIS